MKNKICVICKKSYVGYGNNAQPVKDGLCCDDCNKNIIIKIRLLKYLKDNMNKGGK